MKANDDLLALILTFGPADVMFARPVYAWSLHARAGMPQAFSEVVATFGLLAVIWGCSRRRSETVPFAVAAYITGAYWFTAQFAGGFAATALFRWLVPALPAMADRVVVPRSSKRGS